jgi:hypothetical protein
MIFAPGSELVGDHTQKVQSCSGTSLRGNLIGVPEGGMLCQRCLLVWSFKNGLLLGDRFGTRDPDYREFTPDEVNATV